ncbi:hypothetical protein LMK08_18135 [Metapseudomonas furukawaii]|nr:hypothetical protein [Pseudomonas furukawaii]WAG77282.1 hypothetical protein LMK08_18135 [Pseudomonas furukawaii]
MPVSAPIRLPSPEQSVPPAAPVPYQLPLPFPPREQLRPLLAHRRQH